MYALIYAIRIFWEYSLHSSKMAVVVVESRQQSTIPLPGRDVKTSNSSLKIGFQTKNRFFLEISNAQCYWVVVFYLLLISVATIAAARAQYVLSFVVERGTCLKYKD